MAKYMEMICKVLLLTVFIIHQCVGPPTKQKEPGQDNHDNSSSTDSNGKSLDDLGVEYNRYLKEVVEALESDAEFRKKLEQAEEVDFRNGKVAAELEYVNHNVRTKLDELKRTELQRLKQLVKESEKLEKQQKSHHDIAGHLDHSNEHTFEVADLHKLITKVRLDLEEADKRRREEFKEYEMQKKFEQEQKMKTLDEEHKKKYEEELEAQKKKHQKHEPKLHHPGSKAQLEEVWEKEDHMENQNFNPRTFFHLHDLDGNGYWDEEEVKALFLKEVQKLYDPNAPEDDMRDRQEELERMREHVFSEGDTNRDRLISYAEFLEQTKKQEFERDDGWESIDQKPQFTQQEYEEFERRRQAEIQRLIEQGLLHPYAPGMMPPPQYGAHPAQFQQHPGQAGYIQPHPGMNPNQMPQYQYGGQVQHPNQMPQHPNQMPQHPNQIPQQQQYVVKPGPGVHQVPQQEYYQYNQVNQQQQQHIQQVPPVQQANQQVPPVQQVPVQQQQQQQQQQNQPSVQQPPSQQYQQNQQPVQPPSQQYQQPPPQQQQQQPQQIPNNIPQQRQYQSQKFETQGNKIASNEKTPDNSPK